MLFGGVIARRHSAVAKRGDYILTDGAVRAFYAALAAFCLVRILAMFTVPLETMLEHYRNGYEMVYAVRAHRQDEPRMKRILSHAFYRFVSYGGEFEIPPDARDFRLMDRRDVDALCALLERNRFMKGLYGWVGFRSIAVPVELEERQTATSKLGFKGLLKLGLTGLTSFTDRPLRIWTGIGMTLACLSIVYDAGLT